MDLPRAIETLREPLREASFLVEVSRADIAFERDFGQAPLMGTFDSRLLSQAFGNLIKNAAEAIEAAELESGRKGTIRVRAKGFGSQIVVDVIDNGKGASCTAEDVEECVVVDGPGPRVLLVGDSFANMLGPMFEALAEDRGFSLA